MSHFQTRVKNFFAIRKNFFSRRPFGRSQLVGANGFMRLFDPTVKHFSAKNFTDLLHADCLFNQHTEKTQKNVWIFLASHQFSSRARSPHWGRKESPTCLFSTISASCRFPYFSL